MPTITLNLKEFNKMAGREFTMKELEDNLPMLGTAWEGSTEGEFSVEVFPNRPDMLSLEGLARAFSSFMNIKKGLRNYKAENSNYSIKVDPKLKEIRPYIVSCVIKNVNFTDELISSIMQLQEKLHMTHCRKRKKAAIGIYDFDKIAFPLKYTLKSGDTKFIPLGGKKEMDLEEVLRETQKGKEYGFLLKNLKEFPVLMDSNGKILSLIPILNSDDTKITEKTKNILVEVTGTNEKTALEVLNIVITSFADHGSSLYSVKIEHNKRTIMTPDLNPKKIEVSLNYINKLLGLNLLKRDVENLLESMGYKLLQKRSDKTFNVLIPCYRTDIMHPIDIVEDVAIAYRYNNFKPEKPDISTIGGESPLESFSRIARELIIGFGFQEVVTFMLTNVEKLFKKMGLKKVAVAEIRNPKTQEFCVVRNSLISSIMEVLSHNTINEYPQKIFELGDVILLDPKNDLGAKTVRKLCIASCHRNAGFSEIKGTFESILQNLGLTSYNISEVSRPYFIKGRAAEIDINGEILGVFGEIHPQILNNWNIEMPVSLGEIDFTELLSILKKQNKN